MQSIYWGVDKRGKNLGVAPCAVKKKKNKKYSNPRYVETSGNLTKDFHTEFNGEKWTIE